MKVTITPTRLEGQIRIPSSKSMTHREIIASALAHGESRLTGVSWSQDIEATVRILSLLGASIQRQEGTEGTTLLIKGGLKAQEKRVTAHAGESGSTLRFLIPLGLVSGLEGEERTAAVCKRAAAAGDVCPVRKCKLPVFHRAAVCLAAA